MAKSSNNFYTLRDIIDKGCDPTAFRYLCLSTHYRSQMNFTFEALQSAKNTVKSINDFAFRLKNAMPSIHENTSLLNEIKHMIKLFEKHMNDDLDAPNALSTTFDLFSKINKAIDKDSLDKESLIHASKFIENFDSIFDVIEHTEEISNEDKKLIEDREYARRVKDFDRSDAIREELKRKGILVEDTPNGPVWKKIHIENR